MTALPDPALPDLAVPLDLPPMESEPVADLPAGRGWQFEPKWDGFRALAFRDRAAVALQSRHQRPLGRYFPELLEHLAGLPVERFVLDGEIVVEGGGPDGFAALQLRLHPAASRVARLAAGQPATFVAFDLLVDGSGRPLLDAPLAERRAALEAFVAAIGGDGPRLRLSPAVASAAAARRWLDRLGPGIDGIVAKRRDLPYQPGERAMLKWKPKRTVDCVVAGIYRKDDAGRLESLLLGLYDPAGLLHYVGRVPVGRADPALEARLAPLVGGAGAGFTGRAPGGPSRWSARRRRPVPLRPVLVAEVAADQVTGERFRHPARLLRWRDDKPPSACSLDQLRRPRKAD
ncbi:MAG: ATP-dependent DNA ligase [Dongiaceae bacterium]